ncbi:hypothetical protein HanRHA438_Chr11g0494321 [Helianthus annuus]|nr:hypothetical protein HanHA300_Chr11g0394401 [Helianthus annuus]KAJ0688710.1 hypothetical protein HanOQP8_Chr11g0397311 [Helianthus annuus]KAJ0869911.1 hypothetical protein HanRHA438_Chr11g0494321 [Helianthus annuus]
MEPQGTGEDGEHDGGMAVVGGFDEAVFFIGNKYSERGVEDEDNYAGVFESSSKDIVACDGEKSPVEEVECLVVVFINSKSGGRHDSDLMARLQDLMGQEQFFFFIYCLKKHLCLICSMTE